MKIKNLVKIIYTLLLCIKSEAMVQPGTNLSNFNYTGASVLPITSWGPGKKYVLLSEEARGSDKGKWDDFGGAKDPHENHPLQTASREAWEESVNLLTKSENFLTNYIDLKSGNTQDIVVSIDKSMVTYITNFNPTDLEYLTKNFYSKLKQTTNHHLTEKSRLAWINYDDLKKVVANAPRNTHGQLITPITITANIINPKDPSRKGQIKNQQISLRPVFVSKLQDYFKNSDYIQGTDPKIKFFKRGYIQTPISKPVIQPIVNPTSPIIPIQSTLALNGYDYKEASVLPITSWPDNRDVQYILLSQEAFGGARETWNDLGGSKNKDEKDAASTAAREAWEKSANLLMSSEQEVKNYIQGDQTIDVIISVDKQMVTYLTRFYPVKLDTFAEKFNSKLLQITDPKLKAIKALAWVKYDDLKQAIKNSSRNAKGELITPIQVRALEINTHSVVQRKEPTGQYTTINLRPLFVSKLQEYFKGSPYTQGADPKIKFFKRNRGPLVIPPIKPPTNSIDNLKLLSSILSSLDSLS